MRYVKLYYANLLFFCAHNPFGGKESLWCQHILTCHAINVLAAAR